jgi:hypothetical protein
VVAFFIYILLKIDYFDNGNGTIINPTIPAPETNYSDNGNGTITDNRTGLIWLKNANCFGFQNWYMAQQSVANLANGQCDLSDGSTPGTWRLPTKDELKAMVDDRYFEPALSNATGTGKWSKGDVFFGVQSTNYWSATPNAHNTTEAWRINLYQGRMYGDTDKSYPFYVWPVRK